MLVAVVLAFAGKRIVSQWNADRGQPLHVELRWAYVVAAAASVITGYLVLIETWRVMVNGAGAALKRGDAIRIWWVSSLARYLPGSFWQVGAIGVMAQEAGVRGVTASVTAAINTAINVATGIAIALLFGGGAMVAAILSHLHAAAGRRGDIGVVLLVVAVMGLVATPMLMEPLLNAIERATGKRFFFVIPSRRWLLVSVAGNTIAWGLNGIALWLLTTGVLGGAPGAISSYIAVYSAAYVLGLLALIAPAGAGVRDAAIAAALPAFVSLTVKEAGVVALASRVLLTILEIGPALVLLALTPALRRSKPPSSL